MPTHDINKHVPPSPDSRTYVQDDYFSNTYHEEALYFINDECIGMSSRGGSGLPTESTNTIRTVFNERYIQEHFPGLWLRLSKIEKFATMEMAMTKVHSLISSYLANKPYDIQKVQAKHNNGLKCKSTLIEKFQD